ncbi:hypothetical protein ASPWEDRAFT_318186 [Aspergillus wentii DTO 134E9]|uniref:Rhodopsin domain-containing protein n=1 Tax=Aspergillus wentii DTO 134E9 TaxID=1073089 RepID=A0A1L9RTK0_ASPWE|nr:uncharacterized protein ASPWEDRAFT_318186 [Aspergillus wentii DTO 134E9]OJJ38281.1 hypothetical protein ASPWEDRAFT_318186 [Aspergillus wentii DTO 134E9]
MAIDKAEVPASGSVLLEQSKVGEVIICNTILIVITSCGLSIRGFVEMRYLNGLRIDGALCVVSWGFAFILCFISMWMTRYGYGRHMTFAEADTLAMVTLLKLNFVTLFVYLISLAVIKASFCLLYMRLFRATYVARASMIILVFIVCQFIEEIAVVIFHCSPIRKFWDAGDKVQGRCFSLLVFYYVSFATRLVTDLVIFALPIPILLKLNLESWKKAGLILMFALGLLVCATSIIRCTYLEELQNDFTWNLVAPLNWSAVEVCLFIFISCIPSLKALVNFHSPILRRVFRLSSTDESQRFDSPEQKTTTGQSRFKIRPAYHQRHMDVENSGLPSPLVEDSEESRAYMAGGRLG